MCWCAVKKLLTHSLATRSLILGVSFQVNLSDEDSWDQVSKGHGYNKSCVLYPRPLTWQKEFLLFLCQLWALLIVIKRQFFTFISETTRQNFTKFSVRVICGRGSVLLWRHCNTLCTSGFVDDVMSMPERREDSLTAQRQCLWIPRRRGVAWQSSKACWSRVWLRAW